MNEIAGHDRSARSVFLIFLRLGMTSFGGPIAHIGDFRDEFVTRRQWLTERSYADLVALCLFLPGPASSQVSIAIGLFRSDYAGALAAWAGFTLPSAIMLILFALGIADYGNDIPSVILHGLKVAAVAVGAQAIPGPLFTFAAFLGASVNETSTGWLGGTVCLLAIFTPSFPLIVGVLPFWERLRRSPVCRPHCRASTRPWLACYWPLFINHIPYLELRARQLRYGMLPFLPKGISMIMALFCEVAGRDALTIAQFYTSLWFVIEQEEYYREINEIRDAKSLLPAKAL